MNNSAGVLAFLFLVELFLIFWGDTKGKNHILTWHCSINQIKHVSQNYIEDITRWREDMSFIFEWQNNILRTNAASE